MGKIRCIYAVLANKIRYIFLCSCVFMSRFGGDLNPMRDGYHCWLSNAFACLARRKNKDAQVSTQHGRFFYIYVKVIKNRMYEKKIYW